MFLPIFMFMYIQYHEANQPILNNYPTLLRTVTKKGKTPSKHFLHFVGTHLPFVISSISTRAYIKYDHIVKWIALILNNRSRFGQTITTRGKKHCQNICRISFEHTHFSSCYPECPWSMTLKREWKTILMLFESITWTGELGG